MPKSPKATRNHKGDLGTARFSSACLTTRHPQIRMYTAEHFYLGANIYFQRDLKPFFSELCSSLFHIDYSTGDNSSNNIVMIVKKGSGLRHFKFIKINQLKVNYKDVN